MPTRRVHPSMLPLRFLAFTLALQMLGQTPTHPPSAQPDAWQSAPVVENGLSQSKLDALTADVHSGKFVKIGSVLVARHGKLIYESYFDGDAASLSATHDRPPKASPMR